MARRVSLIFPPHRPNIYQRRKDPFIYLGGPVLGAADWQYDMTELLRERVPGCIVANPKNCRPGHPHHRLRLPEGPESQHFERQRLWERHYMLHAAKTARRGALIFWLSDEDRKRPRADGNPFAMITRMEVGEWLGRLMYDRNLRVVIGADKAFPGLQTIICDFDDALGTEFEIYSSMEAVANAAAEMVYR